MTYFFIFLGKGTMTWKKSGTIYDGDWKDDRRCGFGTYSVSEGGGYRKVYSGGWKNDKRHVCVCNFSWFFFFFQQYKSSRMHIQGFWQ